MKSANFTYTFSDLEFLPPRQCGELVGILYEAKIKDDYERIRSLAFRFVNALASHTFLPWDEEMTILARKADGWLVELEKLEANMFWADKCAAARKLGREPLGVGAGRFISCMTGRVNRYAAGEGRCSWHLESPDGKIVLSGDERSRELAPCS